MDYNTHIEFKGHFFDTLLLPKLLDTVIENGAECAIKQIEIGKSKEEESYIRLKVFSSSKENLEKAIAQLTELGGKEVDIIVKEGVMVVAPAKRIRGRHNLKDLVSRIPKSYQPGEVDWDGIFGGEGVRWFHTGGIFSALSETTAETVIEAMESAKRNGTVVSYDLNYRPSLWKAIGGEDKAREVNRRIAPLVDVMIGNEEDFTASLGFEVEGLGEDIRGIELNGFKSMIRRAVETYPNFRAVATTLRDVVSATVNHWSAVLWYNGEFHKAIQRDNLEILDRVGGGDSFASGLIYGFLAGKGASSAVEYGAAHGALAMTTPGDTTMASLDEVEKLIAGGSARVDR